MWLTLRERSSLTVVKCLLVQFLLSEDTASFLLGLNGKIMKGFIVFKWICIIRNGEAATIFLVIVIYNVQGVSDTVITRQSSCPQETYSLGQGSKKHGP